MSDELLAEQQRYYEARSAEYNDWWERRGEFDDGPEVNEVWRREAAEAQAALAALDVSGDVLELAAGTGNWSRLVAPRAATLTIVDGSPAMLAHNPVVGLEHVTVIEADLFAWDTDARFDVVVFAFWISHVPLDWLDAFLRRVSSWLRPGGRVFCVDSRFRTAHDSTALVSFDGDVHTRRVADGSTYRVVKVFHDAAELRARFDRAGFDVEVRDTPTKFQYVVGTRR